jgi:hypothetical protein
MRDHARPRCVAPALTMTLVLRSDCANADEMRLTRAQLEPGAYACTSE